MKLGSLFDGIGGFPLVASWHGIEPVWASEIEPACISITKRHFPNMQHLGDITKINGAEIEPVDIITFGSPCQDLSVAGKRAGLAGARSGLFGEAIRIIEEMREATNGLYPTWAIWENVPGALSSNDGLDFRAVLQSFTNTEIPMPVSGRWADAGMVRGGRCDVGWRILDAQFWGVPQRRKRIFLVADFRGKRAAEVLFKPEGLSRYFATGRAAGEGASTNAEDGIDGTDYLTPWDPQRWRIFTPRGKCPTLDAGDGGGGRGGIVYDDRIWPDVARTLTARHDSSPCVDRGQNFVYDCRGKGDGRTSCTLTGDHQNRVTDYTAIAVFAGGNGAGAGLSYSEKVAPTLKAAGAAINQAPTICFGIKSFGEYEMTEVSKTLLQSDDITTSDLIASVDCRNLNENGDISGTLQAKATGGYSLNYTNPVREGMTVRRLTPVECERLQGFPDDWTRWGYDGKEISDSARYKAIGNSLALPCVEYLILGIVEATKAAM